MLHHWVAVQLLSWTHALPHAPVASQRPRRRASRRSTCSSRSSLRATPHEVHAPPLPGQYGAEAGQVAVAAVPLSPLHATHVSETASQSGVAPEQLAALVAVHCSQSPLPPLAVVSHSPLRQTPLDTDASADEHRPTPFG